VRHANEKETRMATTEEIQPRVEQADTARSAKRSAAAQQVGELAQRRPAIAEQLESIERELGDVLAGAQDVIDIDELARFTDVPAADLTRWLTAHTARKPNRAKRTRPAIAGPGAQSDTRTAPRRPSPTARAQATPGPPGPDAVVAR
jgi:hypothetical protein